ncbi:MAG: hypothetical protein ABIN80_15210 [Dyadobacter sp.]|uniref:hypothetical protein n=1 Tax=Dyadobacter sp. TaxID=1914288 RepID=UPI00326750C1
MQQTKSTFGKVWSNPIIIGICSGVGLLAALTGNGIWNVTSWLTLGLPVVITVWFLSKPGKKTRSR